MEMTNGQFFVTTIDKFVRWAQKSSIWPLTFGLACCAIEMMNLVGPRYDAARFGSEVLRASPRQADLMIVSGRLSLKMVPVIQQMYQQMPEPKWVDRDGSLRLEWWHLRQLRHGSGRRSGHPCRRVRAGLPADARCGAPRHLEVEGVDRARACEGWSDGA